jgi:hypothetical protein
LTGDLFARFRIIGNRESTINVPSPEPRAPNPESRIPNPESRIPISRSLSINGVHRRRGITRAGCHAGWNRGFDLEQIVSCQTDRERTGVFFQPLATFRSRNRHDVVAAREQPRDGELRRCASFAFRKRLHAFDDREVLLEVLSLKARMEAAEVIGRQILGGLSAPGQESASQRTVGDEADAELTTGRQQSLLGIACPQRILRLQRRDRMHRVRTTNRGDAGFG